MRSRTRSISPRNPAGNGPISRRAFCAALGIGALGSAAVSCRMGDSLTSDTKGARLTARPRPPSGTITAGLHRLLPADPTCFLLVPQRYQPAQSVPLVAALHGAGGTAEGPLTFLGPYAESDGFLLLVPESRGATWDAILDSYGPDIATINAGLRIAFDRAAVDPERVCLEGFSDGASYALGVGILNADLFPRVVAFSPGFITPTEFQTRKPSVFVSHGRQDPILPIDLASRVIVPELRRANVTVEYVEYEGVHSVPPTVARAGIDFVMRSPAA